MSKILDQIGRPVRVASFHPHVLGIDPGVTHPTCAILSTCNADEHIHVVDSYHAVGEDDVEVHAKRMMEMLERCHQIKNKNFFALRADDRDPFFWGSLAKYTKNRIFAVSIMQIRPKAEGEPPWTKAKMKLAAVLRIKHLLKHEKFTIDPACGAYEQFELSWAEAKWDEDSDEERPAKQDGDDPMDALYASVLGLHPPSLSQARVAPTRTKEPPIEQLVKDAERAKREEEDSWNR
jgi:hypothetical protein